MIRVYIDGIVGHLRESEVRDDGWLVKADARRPNRKEGPDHGEEPQALVFQGRHYFAEIEIVLSGSWRVGG